MALCSKSDLASMSGNRLTSVSLALTQLAYGGVPSPVRLALASSFPPLVSGLDPSALLALFAGVSQDSALCLAFERGDPPSACFWSPLALGFEHITNERRIPHQINPQ